MIIIFDKTNEDLVLKINKYNIFEQFKVAKTTRNGCTRKREKKLTLVDLTPEDSHRKLSSLKQQKSLNIDKNADNDTDNTKTKSQHRRPAHTVHFPNKNHQI